MNKLTKSLSIFVAAVLVITQQTIAAEILEQERNDPVTIAQFIVPGMQGFELAGVLGNLEGALVEDVDFFRFYGQVGDVVTLDIDSGIGGQRSINTILAVFGDAPGHRMLRMNDDGFPIDEGSIHRYDARIDNFVLPWSGVYYVGVSHYPRYFRDGGVTTSGAPENGDYRLVISGVRSSVVHINISVKPGKNDVAPLNPNSWGHVPVALLSSDNFNPKDVDVTSLTFGHDGSEDSLEKCNNPSADINQDGKEDLVCHFDNQLAAFRKGDLEGVLKGSMNDGTTIEGRGLLKVVPEKAR